MKNILAAVCVCVLTLACAGPAGAKPGGFTTVTLRACVDGGDSTCQTTSDVALDGVTVCFRQASQAEQCVQTEDGEYWQDSLSHGSYWARVVPPAGYRSADATCTTYPNLPYEPCQTKTTTVHVVVHKGANAVNVNFLLVLDY